MNIETSLDVLYSSKNINRKKFNFPRLIIGLVILAGLTSIPSPLLAVVPANTAFEWSMPDRLLENISFPGYDANSPIPKYDPNALMLPPAGWLVNFDACASSAANIVSYEWLVDGIIVATVTECLFSHQFPKEDAYQITLKLTDDTGNVETLNQEIIVQDWLIIALGDSYGSGEGNPLIPVSNQAHVDFNFLTDLADNIKTDIENALDQLPGLEEAQQAKQQLHDDALVIRDQAATDLNALKQDLQNLLVIQTNVEGDATVTAARNNVISAQQNVASWQAKVNADQQDYDNCSGFFDCAAKLTILEASKLSLVTAKANLAAAETALLVARNAAIIIYSAIASIQNFSELNLALDAATAAVNLAQNTYNAAQNAYQNAADALQQAIDAVASLQSIIADLQQAWTDAKISVLSNYLDTLPVWTETPPSWAGEEPDFSEIVFNLKNPGEALRCHRSMISGQARAALAMEQSDPHTSVTLVHLSCTGAKIDAGLKDGYEGGAIAPILKALQDEGILPGPTLEAVLPQLSDLPDIKSQVEAAADIVLGREVDAIVISIGGNDVRFASMIENCVLGEPCHSDALPPSQDFNDALKLAIEQNCNPGSFINFLTGSSLPTGIISFNDLCLSVYDTAVQTSDEESALDIFNANIAILDIDNPVGEEVKDNGWVRLDTKLNEQFSALDSRRIYFTEYPDPTGDDNGNYCGWDPTQTTTIGSELKNLPGVTQPEMIWADLTVATAIREMTENAATVKNWVFISETGNGDETISSATRNHGYCADDHWIVTIPETFLTQRDPSGIVHPNRKGHEVYKQAIYAQLVLDFYPNGIDFPPRVPDANQVTQPPESAPEGSPVTDDNNSVVAVGSSGGGVTLLLLVFLFACGYMGRIFGVSVKTNNSLF